MSSHVQKTAATHRTGALVATLTAGQAPRRVRLLQRCYHYLSQDLGRAKALLGHFFATDWMLLMIRSTAIILKRAFGRGGVYGCGGAEQGATTPNSQSIQEGATPLYATTTVQSAP